MIPKLIKIPRNKEKDLIISKIYLFDNEVELKAIIEDKGSQMFIKNQLDAEHDFFFLRSPEKIEVFVSIKTDTKKWDLLEYLRR